LGFELEEVCERILGLSGSLQRLRIQVKSLHTLGEYWWRAHRGSKIIGEGSTKDKRILVESL